ncbi:hypothetical protein BC830DRAFT_17744 [Chytriomyces sp. MP71]|nr:hypothetical protein BC830DRAFT_17744 [Chytriomyces sp. MP71]
MVKASHPIALGNIGKNLTPRRRKMLVICCGVSVLFLIIFALVAVFAIGPAIAQAAINGSTMNLGATSITSPSNTSFQLQGTGTVTNAGFLNAQLNFPDPVSVYWTNRDSGVPDLLLGTLSLSQVSVGGAIPKSGSVNLATTFNIADQSNMGAFATYMIHAPSFSWLLSGTASASALGLTFNNLKLNKVVTLGGFAGLTKVNIKSFSPTAGQGNSTSIAVETVISNPSNITIEMGSLFFKFKLGTGDGTLSSQNVTMSSGDNDLMMQGSVNIATDALTAQVQSSSTSNNVIPLSVQGDHVESKSGHIGWLNQGIQSLTLNINMNLTDIAQNSITGSSLSLSSTSIDQATENSLHLVGAGFVTNAGVLDATLSFPDPISVYWTARPEGAPDLQIGTMTLSNVTVSGPAPKSGSINLDTTMKISDTTAMGQFATFMINGDAFSWKLVGGATAQAFGLSFTGLTLSKIVNLKGFGGLRNPSVTSFNLPDSDATGIHVVTGAAINNPSTITINMGNMNFDMQFNNQSVGSLTAQNVIMAPGTNNVNMDGRLKSSNSQLLSSMMTQFLTGGGLNVNVLGNSVSTNGQQPSWLNSAFRTLSLPISLPSPKLTQPLVSGLSIPAMTLQMNSQDPSGGNIATSAPVVTTNFNSPFPFHIGITGVATNLQFIDQASGQPFANINLPMGPASIDSAGKVVTTSFSQQYLTVIPGQEAQLANFLKQITISNSVTIPVKGTVSASANTDAGSVTISGIPLSDSVTISGLSGLSSVTIPSSSVVGGDSNGLQLTVPTQIQNPSSNTLQFNSDVFVDLAANGQKVGTARMPNLVLQPGSNTIMSAVTLFVDPNNAAAVTALRKSLSAYMMGQTTPITLVGNANPTIYRSLQPALQSLNVGSNFPGQTKPLVQSGTLSLQLLPPALQTTLNILNPLEAPLTLQRITTSISVNGKVIATADHALASPLIIQVGQVGTTEKFDLTPVLSLIDIQVALKALGGTLTVDTVSSIQNMVGSFQNIVDYNQNGIPIQLKLF